MMTKKTRAVALIPAHNEEENISDVVKGCLGRKVNFMPTPIPFQHKFGDMIWSNIFALMMFQREVTIWTNIGFVLGLLDFFARLCLVMPIAISYILAEHFVRRD